MALNRRQNFVSTQYLQNKRIELHQIALMHLYFIRSRLGLLPPIFCLFEAEL